MQKMNNIDELYSFDENGCICVKADILFENSMIKQREVIAIEQYIECHCGGEMKFINSLNFAGIWECETCKKKTATIYNILAGLKKK